MADSAAATAQNANEAAPVDVANVENNLRVEVEQVAPHEPPQPQPQGPLVRKRGRPVGKRDSHPRKKRDGPAAAVAQVSSDAVVAAAQTDMEKALNERKEAEKRVEKAQASLKRAQKKLENANVAVKDADAKISQATEQMADAMLRAPTNWNKKYKSLLKFKQENGHVIVKSKEPNANMSPQEHELRKLANWCIKQRTHKRQGKLEDYQLMLMDRLGFDWNPGHGNHGEEKWQVRFEELQEYKAVHGDCNVPRCYEPNQKLASWVKTQTAQYRNGLNGKKPALSEERIQLLQGLGFEWGEPAKYTPWEVRFAELQKYKEEYGHVNVPWRWIGNRPLASWVNGQRNKYRDLFNGKPSDERTN